MMSKEKEKTLNRLYKNTFLSEEGKIVLFDILESGHAFDPRYFLETNENLAMNAKRNLAFYILKRTGVKIDKTDDLLNLLGDGHENGDM